MCGFLGAGHVLPQSICALMLFTVWPSLVLPAVLTLVCVDSKHSCGSQSLWSDMVLWRPKEQTGNVDGGKEWYSQWEKSLLLQSVGVFCRQRGKAWRQRGRDPPFSPACALLFSFKLSNTGTIDRLSRLETLIMKTTTKKQKQKNP